MPTIRAACSCGKRFRRWVRNPPKDVIAVVDFVIVDYPRRELARWVREHTGPGHRQRRP